MACMTANCRGIDGGRVRSVNATPGMRLSSEFNPRKTDRRAFLSLFGLEGLQEEPGLDHVTSRLTESKISEVKTYMSNIHKKNTCKKYEIFYEASKMLELVVRDVADTKKESKVPNVNPNIVQFFRVHLLPCLLGDGE